MVCPYEWIAIDGDCYNLYNLNLSSRTPEDTVCQNGDIVNYSPHTQHGHFLFILDLNKVLIFLPLWIENKSNYVLLMHNITVTNEPASWGKYMLLMLPQIYIENIAVSVLSMGRIMTTFQGIPSYASHVHVFCRTSQDNMGNSCETNQLFTCDNGTCILEMYQCDGIFHCQDGSDEDTCKAFCHAKQGNSINRTNRVCAEICQAPSCVRDELYFQCRNGGCIPWSHVCDCKEHCQDGSDEQFCTLCYRGRDLHYPSENGAKYVIHQEEQGIFVCGNKEIILLDWEGDMVNDCHGAADDELRYHMFLLTRERNVTGVLSEHTICLSGFGKCFPAEATCAFELDRHGKTKYCPSGAHFLFCNMLDCQSRYKCPHTYCIEIHMVCDGKFDCPHGEDEGLFCERPSYPGMLRCSESSMCVHARYIGDGTPPLCGVC